MSLLIRRRLLLVAPHVTPRPDASVRVSQGSDIFCQGCAAPKVRACLQTSSLCAAAPTISVSIFRVSLPLSSSMIVGGEKENTRQCFASKITTLRAVPAISKPLSTMFPPLLLLYFLSDLSYKS